MSDIKFACSQCGQHITCDELWMGQQIACPSCQVTLIVPQLAPTPAPVPIPVSVSTPDAPASLVPTPPATSGQPRLSINRTQHVAHTPAAPEPARSAPVYRTFTPPEPEKKGTAMQVVKIVAIVVAFGVGGFFGFKWILALQAKTNAAMADAAKKNDGGEMGHTVGLYQALDITDPDHPGMTSKEAAKEKALEKKFEQESAERKKAEQNMPVIPPVWTLDFASAAIPEGRANGKIGGVDFVAQTTRFDFTENAQVLRLTQGDLMSPDREVLVYLHFSPSEMLPGKSVTVATNSRAASIPPIVKRWKPDPKYAPQARTYASGYVLKLEFGQMAEGEIPGKIYLALPDAEKTVVAGRFKLSLDDY